MNRYESIPSRAGDVGDEVFFTSPAGGTIAGQAYLIGQLLVVAQETTAVGTMCRFSCRGIYALAKATGIAWTEGLLLYWDNTAKNLTTTTTSNTRAGVAAQVQASGDTLGLVRLSGAPAPTGA